MAREVMIEVKGLKKSFRLPTEKAATAKQAFLNWTKGVRGYTRQQVISDISFTVNRGDFFGIVGKNGSGKSTLLKLLADIYVPDEGEISINGSMVAFIELGVGFNAELTGHDNVYLNGAMLGFSVEEIDQMYDEIVEFAELREFMNQKLKNYSSGMQVRLAFSCAIRAKSEILILDEVLAVGDEAFQRKCSEYFEQICHDKNQTVVLVTHDMGSVKRYCNKALLISKGEVSLYGAPNDVADQYTLDNLNVDKHEDDPDSKNIAVAYLAIDMLSSEHLTQNDILKFNLSYTSFSDEDTYCDFCVWDVKSNSALFKDSTIDEPMHGRGEVSIAFEYSLSGLSDGNFKIYASVMNMDLELLLSLKEIDSPSFMLRRTDILNSADELLNKATLDSRAMKLKKEVTCKPGRKS